MSEYCNCKAFGPGAKPAIKCSKGCKLGGGGDSSQAEAASESVALSITNSPCGRDYCGVPDLGNGYGDGTGPRPQRIPKKLIFVVEWYENGSDLIKKYLFLYYAVDGTFEIRDVINKQRFLRRMRLDNVSLSQLFVGNVLNIYGRQMTLVEFADSCTAQYLAPKCQRTFMLIKPDAVPCLGRILQELERNSLRVVRAKMSLFTTESAMAFFSEYSSQPFFSRLLDHVTSSPVVALLILGENAVPKLHCLAGEVDPGVAKLKHPTSLRAMFGTNFIANGLHTSETEGCVHRDSSFFFTDCRERLPQLAPGTAKMSCSTCCIIKPHAVKEGIAGTIIDYISRANYKITAMELFYLDRTHAEEFYEIYKTVYAEYSAMTAELVLGPCYVLEICGRGEKTVCEFRDYVGPRDPAVAKKIRPDSLRALFGTTKVRNAVHCTDLTDDAYMELDYFFRILQTV